MISINSTDLQTYLFHYENICSWVAKQIDLHVNVLELEDKLWSIGSLSLGQNAKEYFVLFSEDYQKAKEMLNSIRNKTSSILFFGEIPKAGYVDKRIVSLTQFMKITSLGIEFIKEEFKKLSKERHLTSSEENVMLDEHIVLIIEATECYLLLQKTATTFDLKIKIRPTIYKIINYLYKCRNKNVNSFTSKQLSETGLAKNARTITQRISELNRLCRQNNQKEPVIREAHFKYRLNPALNLLD